MAWIKVVRPDRAKGPLRAEYDAAVRRAGRVYQILQVQSLNPAAMRASLRVYKTLMFGPSPLTRAQREMIAVVVSKANLCHY